MTCRPTQNATQRPPSASLIKFPNSRSGAQHSTARRPHVCFVAPNIWPIFSGDPNIEFAGGAEAQQSILARLLARKGYRVSIICDDYGQPARVVRDGVTLIKTYRPQEGIPILRFIHPRLTSTWGALREVNADIYYQRAAGMLTAVVAAYCRWHGKRAIYAGASDSDFDPGKQIIRYRRDRWLFKRGLAMVDAVVVQNARQKHLCAEHYGRDATLIPSCYELPSGANPGPGDCVLWVAALRQLKRPELFLDIARCLPQRRFVMIGGPADTRPADRQYFEDIRRAAMAVPNVEFVGFLPLKKVELYFDQARVVVNTSGVDGEGMPNVFLQAWARGVPTVAFSDTGSRLHGEPVYPVVNNVAEAAAVVERMFTDEHYRASASSRCLDYFTLAHGSKMVLTQYEQLLADVARAGRH